jgi:hypothetical protein
MGTGTKKETHPDHCKNTGMRVSRSNGIFSGVIRGMRRLEKPFLSITHWLRFFSYRVTLSSDAITVQWECIVRSWNRSVREPAPVKMSDGDDGDPFG